MPEILKKIIKTFEERFPLSFPRKKPPKYQTKTLEKSQDFFGFLGHKIYEYIARFCNLQNS